MKIGQHVVWVSAHTHRSHYGVVAQAPSPRAYPAPWEKDWVWVAWEDKPHCWCDPAFIEAIDSRPERLAQTLAAWDEAIRD